MFLLLCIAMFEPMRAPTATADELAQFSGQGIPRKTKEDCDVAAKKLVEMLNPKGFWNLKTGCVGTNRDVGEFVPTLNGTAPLHYATEQGIGSQLPSEADCKIKLAEMTSPIAAADLLESECLSGTDLYKNNARFYQPWLTKLVAATDQQHSKLKIESGKSRGVATTATGKSKAGPRHSRENVR